MTSTTSFSSTTSTQTSTATPDCTSAIPDKNEYLPPDACGSNWLYYPSFGAALFFAVVFGLSLTIHIFQATYHKKWRFCWVIIMAVTWEFAAFVLRTVSTRNQLVDTFQIISTLLVLLAPIWINAFVYMVLGRMMYFFLPDQQVWGVKAIKIAKIFVWLDILAFLVQAGGGCLINPDAGDSLMMTGIHIYMAGMGLQQLFILLFLSITVKFHLLMRTPLLPRQISPSSQNWKPLLYTLYATLLLITIRVLFRLVEFSKGIEPEDNAILAHEAYFMCLDALPVAAACVLLNVVHPGGTLRGEGSEFPKGLCRKEKREKKRVEKEEKLRIKEEIKMRKKEGKGGVELGVVSRI